MTTGTEAFEPIEFMADMSERMEALQTAVDQDKREKERAELMREYEARDGKWKYAPDKEKKSVRASIKAAQAARAGEALYRVGRLVMDMEGPLNDAVERAKLPPAPLDAWMVSHKLTSHSLEQELLVNQLEELRQTRLEHQLDRALPSAVIVVYEEALRFDHPDTVRYVERRHGQRWSGLPSSDPKEATTVAKLRRRINEVRDARVPLTLRQAAVTMRRAKDLMQRAQTLHQIVARRPERE